MAMTDRDRKVLLIVVAFVLVAASWFLLISPKRAAVAEAQTARDNAAKELETAKQAEIAVKAVKIEKPEDYAKLIKLGAAIPTDDDFESLLVQFNDIANDANVEFSNLAASGGQAGAGSTAAVGGSSCDTAPGAAPATEIAPSAATGAASTAATGSTAQTWVGKSKEKAQDAAAATEAHDAAVQAASCASAPTLADLSAQAAGLTSIDYTLTFKGSFFDLDTMFGDILGLVKTHNGQVKVNGRLLDITTISLAIDSFPNLTASVQMTGYMLPAQAAAAATPAAPAAPAGTPAASTAGQ
jgi:hypothetical protein